MADKFKLGELLSKYGMDYEKVVGNNPTILKRGLEDISKIIYICQKYELGSPNEFIFTKNPEYLEEVGMLIKKNEIKFNPIILTRKAEDIAKIIDICKQYKIGNPDVNMFSKSVDKIEEIAKICEHYNVEISNEIFSISRDELLLNISDIQNKYGNEYLKSSILSKSNEQLNTVFPYLDSLGVLPSVIDSSSILNFKLEAIEERTKILNYFGLPIVDENGNFNSIYDLNGKDYAERKKELGVTPDVLYDIFSRGKK